MQFTGSKIKVTNDVATRQLIAVNLHVLIQGANLLEQIDDELYLRTMPPLFDYGAGSHFRHLLDSYHCFLKGLIVAEIDYDRRERDERIEKDRAFTITRLRQTAEQLHELTFITSKQTLQVRQDSSYWSESSLERELQFLLSHTIHHYALIALILRLQGFAPAAEFGVAPSTLVYWEEKAACAQ